MSDWESYPSNYRAGEVLKILSAVQAGECAALIGLSGAGKSNLLGFLVNRVDVVQSHVLPGTTLRLVLVDCNWLEKSTPASLFDLICTCLVERKAHERPMQAAYAVIREQLAERGARLCLLFDRFERLMAGEQGIERSDYLALMSNLRALRDTFKYRLTYVIATRRQLEAQTELAELFFANTFWLGPLQNSDARWNVTRYARRRGLDWDELAIQQLINVSWGYPSLLRAACEAYDDGASLDLVELAQHPAIRKRVEEFWADRPEGETLRLTGLEGQPLLLGGSPAKSHRMEFDTSRLTAKEYLLLDYFQRHVGVVCEKDDLIRAVWPEDKIFEGGIRDDSLAQLIRRLREKIEVDASSPLHIHTVPGRGYRFINQEG